LTLWPKNTHFQTTFSMRECDKTHLQQCRISKKISGGGLPDLPGGEGRGRGREWRRRPQASAPKTIIRHCICHDKRVTFSKACMRLPRTFSLYKLQVWWWRWWRRTTTRRRRICRWAKQRC